MSTPDDKALERLLYATRRVRHTISHFRVDIEGRDSPGMSPLYQFTKYDFLTIDYMFENSLHDKSALFRYQLSGSRTACPNNQVNEIETRVSLLPHDKGNEALKSYGPKQTALIQIQMIGKKLLRTSCNVHD